jgi:hypothetical protein
MHYAEFPESEFAGSCATLLEAAHPEIYRRNAFRITGLPVDVSSRDIARHEQKLEMMRKYNSVEWSSKAPLPLNPPPDEYTTKEAVQRLNDPEKRLIDEFFWFWPIQQHQRGTDDAIALLTAGDIQGAAAQWLRMEQTSVGHRARHNLAILFHCVALDWEQVALRRKLNQNDLDKLCIYWREACQRWKLLLDCEPFWSQLTTRIRDLDDPRLTTGLVKRMRESLPLALLSINATLAARYAETADCNAVNRQLDIIRTWEGQHDGRLGPLAQQALRNACEPSRQRIKAICKNAMDQVESEPARGDVAAQELIANTKPALAILDALLLPGDPVRDAAHDEVANCVLRCQVAFANKTENWTLSLELLEQALSLAVGQFVRDRIQQNIDIVKRNIECERQLREQLRQLAELVDECKRGLSELAKVFNNCWFCGENPAEDQAAVDVKMYGDVNVEYTWTGKRVTWRHGTVKVPRCGRCKVIHDHTENCRVFGCALGVLVGFAGCAAITGVLWQPDSAGWILLGCAIVLVVATIIGALVGVAIGDSYRPVGVKRLAAKSDYPLVKQLLDEGWKFGERPDTQ